MSSVEWLQHWYRAQCNGEWEHDFGITIQSLDNPGWLVTIDLSGTPLAARPFTPIEDISPGKQDWLSCRADAARFTGAGGPLALETICQTFREWAET